MIESCLRGARKLGNPQKGIRGRPRRYLTTTSNRNLVPRSHFRLSQIRPLNGVLCFMRWGVSVLIASTGVLCICLTPSPYKLLFPALIIDGGG